MKATNRSTSGSAFTIALTSSLRDFIVGNETSCGPSVKPMMSPASCCGKSPFGRKMKSATVKPMLATVTSCMM
jgi:hypothetical protein